MPTKLDRILDIIEEKFADGTIEKALLEIAGGCLTTLFILFLLYFMAVIL